MKTHFIMMLLFSLPTSLVLSFIIKNSLKERLRYFLFLWGCFILLSLAAGWLMYPFPF